MINKRHVAIVSILTVSSIDVYATEAGDLAVQHYFRGMMEAGQELTQEGGSLQQYMECYAKYGKDACIHILNRVEDKLDELSEETGAMMLADPEVTQYRPRNPEGVGDEAWQSTFGNVIREQNAKYYAERGLENPYERSEGYPFDGYWKSVSTGEVDLSISLKDSMMTIQNGQKGVLDNAKLIMSLKCEGTLPIHCINTQFLRMNGEVEDVNWVNLSHEEIMLLDHNFDIVTEDGADYLEWKNSGKTEYFTWAGNIESLD